MEPQIDESIFDDITSNDSTVSDVSMDTRRNGMLIAITDKATSVVCDLWSTWTQLGLPHSRQQDRITEILSLVHAAMDHCVETEKSSMEGMRRYKDHRKQQVADMLAALELSPFDTPSDLPLLHEAKLCRDKFEELKKLKDERMEQLHKLLSKRDSLCHILGDSPNDLKLKTNIPSEFEIMQLQSYVSDLEVTRNKRFNKFLTVKKSLVNLFATLDMEAKSETEKRVLVGPEKEFILSEKNISKVISLHQTLDEKIAANTAKKEAIVERLEYLWKQLDLTDEGVRILSKYPGISDRIIEQLSSTELTRFEVMRKERMVEFIEKVKLEVEQWWDTCCFDDGRISEFKQRVEGMEAESEAVLTEWEDHLKYLQQYFADHKKVFDSLDTWRSCWEEFLAIEYNEKDPDRYKNRRIPSTQIMKEQQQKKQLERKISKLEEQLVTTSRELESQGNAFRIYTTLLSEYVEGKRVEYDEKKENEKAKKKTAKAQMTIQESKGMIRAQNRGGNVVPRSQATPTKRPAQPSHSRDNCEISPSKTRKLANSKQTTPMAPPKPALTRQNTITKSSSSLKKPVVSTLATRGRSASQMSVLSVNEEEFQAGLKAATPARALNSTYVRE